ncbi:MAG: YdeI/OmpD-associated family protein [Caldilineaceae bacterium]
MNPTFFATPDEFRAWLMANHDKEQELWVGYYKKESGKPSITRSESVDQALCFGWIDGIRKSVNSESYMNRFTPRKASSNWSEVNIKKVAELTAQGLMHPAGIKVFETRKEAKAGTYSYERRKEAQLSPEEESEFRANFAAWAYFQSKPPSYREPAIWWVVSAKRVETRQRRLQTLIQGSEAGQTIAPLAQR